MTIVVKRTTFPKIPTEGVSSDLRQYLVDLELVLRRLSDNTQFIAKEPIEELQEDEDSVWKSFTVFARDMINTDDELAWSSLTWVTMALTGYVGGSTLSFIHPTPTDFKLGGQIRYKILWTTDFAGNNVRFDLQYLPVVEDDIPGAWTGYSSAVTIDSTPSEDTGLCIAGPTSLDSSKFAPSNYMFFKLVRDSGHEDDTSDETANVYCIIFEYESDSRGTAIS